MQTIYTYSYNPTIATGTNTTATVWRMAYQQPIMLYKGADNYVKLAVFNNNQKVVDLTNYDIQVKIVDRERQVTHITKNAIVAAPTTGVATVKFSATELAGLDHRFYHLMVGLTGVLDDSTIPVSDILYIDDNYGAFTPVTLEDAWNFGPATE